MAVAGKRESMCVSGGGGGGQWGCCANFGPHVEWFH